MQSSNEYFILENVNIGFGNFILIKNLNQRIYKGEKILLLGSNGTGKTTFLKTLLRIEKPIFGKISYLFRSISYVPQNTNRKNEFLITVEQFLSYFQNKKNPEQIEYIIKKLNLYEKKTILLRECSGGEFQRLNIARALLNQPEVLILDEPLNAVDIENRKHFIELLRELYNEYEFTIIMTSHYLDEELYSFFDRKWTISQNQIFE